MGNFLLSEDTRCAWNSHYKLNREPAVDVLRGFVMIVMVLDHVCEFLLDVPFDPLDLSQTDAALFITRWVSHFCAPVFVFIAGMGAFLSTTRGRTLQHVSWRLLTRGLWLVLLEFTIVHFGWFFFNYDFLLGQVIWAIGCSMIALAGLVFLPTWAITTVGVTFIACHNLFDAVSVERLGSFQWLWVIFMSGGTVNIEGASWSLIPFKVIYPVLPWLGIMAAGYGFGQLWQLNRERRRRYQLCLGMGLTLLFVAFRALNLYGDNYPWSMQPTRLFTLFSFLDCGKYPPSLLFVLMTLGPSIFAFALTDNIPKILSQPLVTLGRVPLFFYLVHLPLIHFIAVGLAYFRYGNFGQQFQAVALSGPGSFPPGEGYRLPLIYLVWLIVVLTLYPICHRFAELKRRRPNGWISYL